MAELNVKIPEPCRDSLRIGTCSWKYDAWRGLVYDPAKTYKPYDYLADYARTFDIVEVVSSTCELACTHSAEAVIGAWLAGLTRSTISRWRRSGRPGTRRKSQAASPTQGGFAGSRNRRAH